MIPVIPVCTFSVLLFRHRVTVDGLIRLVLKGGYKTFRVLNSVVIVVQLLRPNVLKHRVIAGLRVLPIRGVAIITILLKIDG